MEWDDEVAGIAARHQQAQQHGGPDAVAKHRARGKTPIRERMQALLDPDSGREVAPIAGYSEQDEQGESHFTPANYALATGRIGDRTVVVGGEDFTIRGGSPSVAGLRKSVFAEGLALRLRVPLIKLLEGSGGSVGRPSSGRPAPPDLLNQPARFLSIMRAMQTVPVAAAALGPVAGMPAARLTASHFSVMVRDVAQVMIAGPAVVERALGGQHSKESLGSADVHLRSGVVHNAARDERDAWQQIRTFLSYLPQHVGDTPPIVDSEDSSERLDPRLRTLIPKDRRKPYKMRSLIQSVCDEGSFFEIQPLFGRGQITGLARLQGHPVGILANDPMFYAGAMTASAAQKMARFVDFCDTFHIPIVSLVDQPGFMIGPEAEQAGTLRFGTAAICAVMQSRVPWVSVMVRKSYGVASAAHYGPEATVLAWPSAEAGALPLEGGVAVAFRREIENSPDPETTRKALEASLAERRDPYALGEAATVYDLIDPAATRSHLCHWLQLHRPLLQLQCTITDKGCRP